MASIRYPCATAYCFPSERDINGGVDGYGRVIYEAVLRSAFQLAGRLRGGLDGFDPPAVGFDVSGTHTCQGAALVNGYYLGLALGGAWECRFPYAVNYCYLRVVSASSKAQEVGIEVYDQEQLPVGSGAVPLWRVTVTAGLVSAVQERRRTGRLVTGCVHGDNGAIVDVGTGDWSFGYHSGSGEWRITFANPYYKTPFSLIQYETFVYAPLPTHLLTNNLDFDIRFAITD